MLVVVLGVTGPEAFLAPRLLSIGATLGGVFSCPPVEVSSFGNAGRTSSSSVSSVTTPNVVAAAAATSIPLA